MKPHVICHMVCSIDGRTLADRWRPGGVDSAKLFETLHDKLDGDAWVVARATGQEFAKASAYPDTSDETFPREPWFARRNVETWGVVLDGHGKIAWGRSDIGGDPILVALTEGVGDAHLAGLRADGVSYVFAGRDEIDLSALLDFLARDLGVKRLLVEGGGTGNGGFLRAGLIDEISLVVCPAVDGARGAPSVFDSTEADGDVRAPVRALALQSSETLDGGAVWLRYRVENDQSPSRRPA